MVSDETIQAIAEHISREFHPKRVIQFGSHARGEATEHSDVDLFVEMERTATYAELSQDQLLTLHERAHDRTHNLEELLSGCTVIKPDMASLRPDAARLNYYAVREIPGITSPWS